MDIKNLIIEVTRKCNMKCKHCLRGEAQNCDIPYKYIDALFENVTSVGHITFTGGEPFLNVGAIEYTLQLVKKKNIAVYGFYLATNAKVVKDRYISIVNEWMIYVIKCNNQMEEMLKGSDNDNISVILSRIQSHSGVSVSRDKYHDDISIENYLKFRMLSYYVDVQEHSDNECFERMEGKALENEIGVSDCYWDISSVYVEMNGSQFNPNTLEIEQLYLSSNGDLVGDCDLSYENIHRYSIGNIGEDSLLNIMKRYCEECYETAV